MCSYIWGYVAAELLTRNPAAFLSILGFYFWIACSLSVNMTFVYVLSCPRDTRVPCSSIRCLYVFFFYVPYLNVLVDLHWSPSSCWYITPPVDQFCAVGHLVLVRLFSAVLFWGRLAVFTFRWCTYCWNLQTYLHGHLVVKIPCMYKLVAYNLI